MKEAFPRQEFLDWYRYRIGFTVVHSVAVVILVSYLHIQSWVEI